MATHGISQGKIIPSSNLKNKKRPPKKTKNEPFENLKPSLQHPKPPNHPAIFKGCIKSMERKIELRRFAGSYQRHTATSSQRFQRQVRCAFLKQSLKRIVSRETGGKLPMVFR